jgi:hypothetical protein
MNRKEGPLKKLTRLAPLLALVLVLTACGTGNVTTSTGAIVPAATVESQDNIADLLHVVREAHRSYIATVWEPTKITLDPVTRANRFRLLNTMADGLDASQALLITWKQINAGASPGSVLRPIVGAAPAFLDLAVQAGLLTQAQANVAKGILASIPVADLMLPCHLKEGVSA